MQVKLVWLLNTRGKRKTEDGRLGMLLDLSDVAPKLSNYIAGRRPSAAKGRQPCDLPKDAGPVHPKKEPRSATLLRAPLA